MWNILEEEGKERERKEKKTTYKNHTSPEITEFQVIKCALITE